MKKFTVTLWRYPSEEREPNAVGVSVFYFNETAETKEQALAQAKEKFQHSVWESHITEEGEEQPKPTPALDGNLPINPKEKFRVKFDGQKLKNQLGATICECLAGLPDESNYAGNYKQRMQYIEKVVNMHDEFMKLAEELVDIRRNIMKGQSPAIYAPALNNLEELFNQAKQK